MMMLSNPSDLAKKHRVKRYVKTTKYLGKQDWVTHASNKTVKGPVQNGWQSYATDTVVY